ncbi:MAG: hypothetical protein A4S09_15275 [Proteobacteria bacterium SG_bin7]|nr:MAG: hypothetical protein A4S09_15275 [Proteobacteria bacterium SG_bin7]
MKTNLQILAALAFSANLALLPSIAFAEDDMMGTMPNQQKDSMPSDTSDATDSTDADHDHDQMMKDHSQMMKDHKKMMKHNCKGKDCKNQNQAKKKPMNNNPNNSGGMDHM